jgi:hypothetical protein
MLHCRYQWELIGMIYLKNIWIARLLDLERRRCARTRIFPAVAAPRRNQAHHQTESECSKATESHPMTSRPFTRSTIRDGKAKRPSICLQEGATLAKVIPESRQNMLVSRILMQIR